MENCKTVFIEGNNYDNHHCLDCGDILSVNDYIYGDCRCKPCRRSFYDCDISGLVDENTTNKIDEILLRKRKGR